MPKMTQAIEGWAIVSSPGAARAVGPPRLQAARRAPEPTGLWKYRTLRRSRSATVWAGLFSLSLHALVFLGFNDPVALKKHVVVHDDPVIQMTMPELEKDEVEPVEALGEEQPEETPSIAVPMLADLPSLIPIDAFVQPLDFTPSLPANLDAARLSYVPVGIARGSSAVEKLGRIFDVSQLDRQPQPIIRPSPIFPQELKKTFTEAAVVLGFIINTKGEVVSPHVISSDNYRFEEAALNGVLKWKFKPGMKAGRAVNTRIEITITFRLQLEQ